MSLWTAKPTRILQTLRRAWSFGTYVLGDKSYETTKTNRRTEAAVPSSTTPVVDFILRCVSSFVARDTFCNDTLRRTTEASQIQFKYDRWAAHWRSVTSECDSWRSWVRELGDDSIGLQTSIDTTNNELKLCDGHFGVRKNKEVVVSEQETCNAKVVRFRALLSWYQDVRDNFAKRAHGKEIHLKGSFGGYKLSLKWGKSMFAQLASVDEALRRNSYWVFVAFCIWKWLDAWSDFPWW